PPQRRMDSIAKQLTKSSPPAQPVGDAVGSQTSFPVICPSPHTGGGMSWQYVVGWAANAWDSTSCVVTEQENGKQSGGSVQWSSQLLRNRARARSMQCWVRGSSVGVSTEADSHEEKLVAPRCTACAQFAKHLWTVSPKRSPARTRPRWQLCSAFVRPSGLEESSQYSAEIASAVNDASWEKLNSAYAGQLRPPA